MPPSLARSAQAQGKDVAIAAEALYLANLLLAPGLAFLALGWLYLRHARSGPELARCHLKQTLRASVWAGVLLLIVNVAAVLLGGWREPATWMVVILYFTVCHSTLVLLGMLGLAKAMAGKPYVFPLIGAPL